MYNYVLFWIRYLLSVLQWLWIYNFLVGPHGLGPVMAGPRAAKPIMHAHCSVYVKITFTLIAYLALLCEFFWEFSFYLFYRPQVVIYSTSALNVFVLFCFVLFVFFFFVAVNKRLLAWWTFFFFFSYFRCVCGIFFFLITQPLPHKPRFYYT